MGFDPFELYKNQEKQLNFLKNILRFIWYTDHVSSFKALNGADYVSQDSISTDHFEKMH